MFAHVAFCKAVVKVGALNRCPMYLCGLSKKIVPMRAIKAVLSKAVVDVLYADFGVQTEPPALQITERNLKDSSRWWYPIRSAGMPLRR